MPHRPATLRLIAGLTAAAAFTACAGIAGPDAAPAPEIRRINGPERPPIPQAEDFSDWRPMVSAVTGPISCYGPIQVPDQEVPNTIYGIRFDTTPKRQIAIQVTPDGLVRSYNELRGAMPFIDTEGDHTGVYIDFANSTLFLLNVPDGGEAVRTEYPQGDALDSDLLDRPRMWIQEILGACG